MPGFGQIIHTTLGALFPTDPILTARDKALVIDTINVDVKLTGKKAEVDYLILSVNGVQVGIFKVSDFSL